MNTFLIFFLFTIGLVLIIKGGDWFVDAAVWIAEKTNVPKVIIGATIVSLATTLPELFVSTVATYKGSPDIAIGNAVGSSICNIGLILAISIICTPNEIKGKMFSIKGFLMIFSACLLLIFGIDRRVSFWEGLLLLCLLILYIYINIKNVRTSKETSEELAVEIIHSESKTVINNIMKFILGIAFIVIGAKFLVNSSIKIAMLFNVPESIISLTLIALGTSLPELTTAISSIIKGHGDLSVGNVIGANILNITMIIGICSFISNKGLIINVRNIELFGTLFIDLPQTIYIDLPMSLLLMLILILSGTITKKLTKPIGFILLAIYIFYIFLLASIAK